MRSHANDPADQTPTIERLDVVDATDGDGVLVTPSAAARIRTARRTT